MSEPNSIRDMYPEPEDFFPPARSLPATLKVVEGGGSVAQLKIRRERMGLSVGDVCSRLKMTPRQIHAMENGSTEGLPPGGYARAFVKSYARLLELDPDAVASALLGSLEESPIHTEFPINNKFQRRASADEIEIRMPSEQPASATPQRSTSASDGFGGQIHDGLSRAVLVLALLGGLGLAGYRWGQDALAFAQEQWLLWQTQAQTATPELSIAQSMPPETNVAPANLETAESAAEQLAQAEPLPTPSVGADETLVSSTVAYDPRLAAAETGDRFGNSAIPAKKALADVAAFKNDASSGTVRGVVSGASGDMAEPAPDTAAGRTRTTLVGVKAEPKPPPYNSRIVGDDISAASPSASAAVAASPVISPMAPAVSNPGTPSGALGSGRPPSLRMTFYERCWVTVRDRNGNVLLSQMNDPGTEKVVEGKGPFKVILGNAHEVKVRHRGKIVDLAPYIREDVARVTLD
ncbi:MAG: helix-turn-helix domain-containing protein [Burkholderiaceae bacterium]|jgi:cytoskeletal protein RodZ